MLQLKKIHEVGIIYKTTKFLSDNFHNLLFYRKVTYTGREKIPKNKPILLGPNHQNALMDAMAILASRKNVQPVFLARSDIFATDILGNFLIGIKILPVYRIRDGKDKLEKNEEIFKLSIEVLEKKRTLVIFPEAQHTPYRSILMLKKGLMRIAFEVADKNNFKLDLQIIPVGIYYSNYQNYRTKLLVNYGNPISIKKYENIFAENKQKAYIELRKDLQKEIIKLAIHIKNKKYYNFYENAREIFDYEIAKKEKYNLKNQTHKFNIDKKIIALFDELYEKNPEKFENIVKLLGNYTENLKKANLKDYLFDKKINIFAQLTATIIWVAALPITIAGFVNFAIPLIIPEIYIKKIKDKQFHSSVRYVISLILPLIWGIIIAPIIGIITKNIWLAVGIFIVQYPLFGTWLELRKYFKKIIGKWRYIFKKKDRKKLKKQKKLIIKNFNEILKLLKN